MSKERAFKGIWIPSNLWLNKELTLMEKIFLVEIDSLDNSDGCFASNAYFAEFFGISKGRCTQIIKSLESKGLIKIELEKDGKQIVKRIVRVVNKLTRVVNILNRGYLENDDDNNTLTNNTLNKDTSTSDEVSHAFQKHAKAKEFLGLSAWYHNKMLNDDSMKNFEHILKDAPKHDSKLILGGAQQLFLLHTKDKESLDDIRKTLVRISEDDGDGSWAGWKKQCASLSSIRKKVRSGMMKYFAAKESYSRSNGFNLVKYYSQDEATRIWQFRGNGRKFTEMFTWIEQEGKYILND